MKTYSVTFLKLPPGESESWIYNQSSFVCEAESEVAAKAKAMISAGFLEYIPAVIHEVKVI